MDPPEHFFAGYRPSAGRRSELQGPRPTPLKVNKDSHKISKPPVAPQQPHHHYHRYLQPPQPPPVAPPHTGATTTAAQTQNYQPVIIYAVSPKVIHTTVSDFMDLVQRLTGSTTTSSSSSTTGETHTAAAATAGDISPAARLASIERTSPSERERAAINPTATAAPVADEEFLRILDETNVQVGQSNIPSILSPAPATLPPVSPPGLFSPTVDPFMQVSNMFIPSPSTLFSAPIASPSPSSSRDLFIQLFDF